MKRFTKGFTLIELLIVIAIIAVLAVAFVPTLLGAPAKGRDTARIADLQKIQKVLVNANLEGKVYPDSGCATTGFGGTDSDYYLAAFGGTIPTDPQDANQVGPVATGCTGEYLYAKDPAADGVYSFGLVAHMEGLEKANALCTDAIAGVITAVDDTTAADELCYAILTQ
ncbi:MAG: type II secretion system protein [Patescibacteria group bacterium]